MAVCAVVAHHIQASLVPGGYLGVDVFFAVSGYVVTGSLLAARERGLRDFLLSFYARRVKRLLPALVLAVAASAVLISLFNPDPKQGLLTGVAALFGLSNLLLARRSTDYFGPAAQLDPFTHTWSLGVEEQFYLLFPLLLWLFGAGGRHARAGWALLAALALASFAAFAHLLPSAPHISYYSMPTRFWELAAGALAFLLTHRASRAHGIAQAATWPAAVGLALAFAAPESLRLAATVGAVACTAVLLVGSRGSNAVGRVLGLPLMVTLGVLSYSIYLWHWPLLVTLRWTLGVNAWTGALLLAATLLVAAASYRFVERPLRHARWSTGRARDLALGAAAAGTAAAFVVVLAQPLQGHLYAGRKPAMTALGVATLSQPYADPVAGVAWGGRDCVLGSNEEAGKTILPGPCTLGDFDRAAKRVLVVGNSFSAAFVPAFAPLAAQDGLAVTITSSWGASPVREVPNTTSWSRANAYYWDAVVQGLLERLRAGDWVLVMSDLSELAPARADERTSAALGQFERGLNRLALELHARGVRLAVTHVNPFAREANCGPELALPQWFAPGGGPCTFHDRQATLDRRAPVDRILRRLEAQGKLAVVDLFEVFCPGPVCTYSARDGTPLYRDIYSHPSVEAARLSTPLIRTVLLPASAR